MKLFISYCHHDKDAKDQLLRFLAPLVDSRRLSILLDDQILAGDVSWSKTEQMISDADLAVVLLSANYLASERASKLEVPALLKQESSRGIRIVPVLVATCLWNQVSWLAGRRWRRLLPSNSAAIAGNSDQSSAWVGVCVDIIRAIDADALDGQPDLAIDISVTDSMLLQSVKLEGPFTGIPPGLHRELYRHFDNAAVVKEIVSESERLIQEHCPGVMALPLSYIADINARVSWASVLSEAPKMGAKAFLAVLLCARATCSTKLPLVDETIRRIIEARDLR